MIKAVAFTFLLPATIGAQWSGTTSTWSTTPHTTATTAGSHEQGSLGQAGNPSVANHPHMPSSWTTSSWSTTPHTTAGTPLAAKPVRWWYSSSNGQGSYSHHGHPSVPNPHMLAPVPSPTGAHWSGTPSTWSTTPHTTAGTPHAAKPIPWWYSSSNGQGSGHHGHPSVPNPHVIAPVPSSTGAQWPGTPSTWNTPHTTAGTPHAAKPIPWWYSSSNGHHGHPHVPNPHVTTPAYSPTGATVTIVSNNNFGHRPTPGHNTGVYNPYHDLPAGRGTITKSIVTGSHGTSTAIITGAGKAIPYVPSTHTPGSVGVYCSGGKMGCAKGMMTSQRGESKRQSSVRSYEILAESSTAAVPSLAAVAAATTALYFVV